MLQPGKIRRVRQQVELAGGEQGQSSPTVRREPEIRSGGILGSSAAPKIGEGNDQVGVPDLDRSIRPLVATHVLRLQNESGVVEVPASNYYLDPQGEVRPFVAGLAELVLTRDPAQQAEIDKKLTKQHARHEMSFRVKDPETGNYDKIFEVPVNGTVVPLRESHFRMIVESTGPVMRALRDLLQRYYADPHATPEALGLGALPEADQKRVIETMRESIYFEPKLAGESMKDYPFLAVGGFDASVGDLDSPRPVFFEYNLGTPSGLSNNIQLLEILRTEDPKMFRALEDQLPRDETFSILRRTIESCARAWTKNPDGISVVISPGVYNGAHPDVASIALFSGMPLVNKSDLYQDAHGNIRLNTGKVKDDPIVTGIYGRMEESFFFQDSKAGIPLRSPSYVEINERLSKQHGVELDPHIIYAHRYSGSEIVGLELDAKGRPQYQIMFEQMGADPSRPNAPPGNFAGAVVDRKLYYSGLGGRVVDDKRIFQMVSQFLAPSFLRGEQQIAAPPRTLEPNEYPEFYASDHLERYVVKEPDKSGGDGVMLLCNLTEKKRREVVEAVKRKPSRYIIQEFAQPAVMFAPEKQKDESWAYATSANDWRIFSMMDAEGNVDAGPQSVLLRAAKFQSASTNTSQGAGYGIGVVMKEEAVLLIGPAPPPRPSPEQRESVLPATPVQEHVGASRRADLIQFLDQLSRLGDGCAPGGQATLLAQFQREVMDLLGRDFSPLMSIARSYDAGELDEKAFIRELLRFRIELMTAESFPARGIEHDVRRVLSRHPPKLVRSAAPMMPDREALLGMLTMEQLEPPIAVRKDLSGSLELVKYETSVVRASSDPHVQAVIDEMAKVGGEVRMIATKDPAGAWMAGYPPAYFRIDEQGRPIIGIDLTQDKALAALAHEREHLLHYLEIGERVNRTEDRVEGEQRALNAELIAEQIESPFNRGIERAVKQTDPGYLTRMLYPEIEGVRDLLHRARWNGEPLRRDLLDGYLTAIIETSLQVRQAAHDEIRSKAKKKLSGEEALRLQVAALAIRYQDPFEMVFDPIVQDAFRTDDTLVTLQSEVRRALENVPASRWALPS